MDVVAALGGPVTTDVVDRCRWCGSPFLRVCTVATAASCRSCGRVVILGRRESFTPVFPLGVVTTIDVLGDPDSGVRIARRWTARGIQCTYPVSLRPEG